MVETQRLTATPSAFVRVLPCDERTARSDEWTESSFRPAAPLSQPRRDHNLKGRRRRRSAHHLRRPCAVSVLLLLQPPLPH
ncbi:unnamed protein product [Ixodes pacificus]